MNYILFVILVVLTILLLSGKGGFLIAGYNMLSKKEKKRYNEKKLSRLLGILLLFVDFGLLADLLFGRYFAVHTRDAFIGAAAVFVLCIVLCIIVIRKD